MPDKRLSELFSHIKLPRCRDIGPQWYDSNHQGKDNFLMIYISMPIFIQL